MAAVRSGLYSQHLKFQNICLTQSKLKWQIKSCVLLKTTPLLLWRFIIPTSTSNKLVKPIDFYIKDAKENSFLKH